MDSSSSNWSSKTPISDSKSTMKLSFSLNSSSKSKSNSNSKPKSTTPQSPPKPTHFVTVFDPTQTLTPNPDPKPQIPPLPNTNQWRSNLLPPSDDDATFETPTPTLSSSSSSTTTYGLTLRSKPSTPTPSNNSTPLLSDDARFKTDIDSLPDDRGIDEFEDVAVEDFSRAILQGYGWKEGEGIGRNNKKDVGIVEAKKWAGTSGLGFSGDLPGDRKEKPGKGKPPLPPIVEEEEEEERGSRRSKEAEVRDGDGRDKKRRKYGESSGGEGRDRSRDSVSKGGERDDRTVGQSRSRDFVSKNNERNGGTDGRDRNRDSVSWLRSQIRVRIISKSIKGGRHYLKKGVITDVVDPVKCDISMDENRELLQGIGQEILETSIPQRGGPVIVLYGRHKGVYGKLMEKDKEKETVVVRDDDSHELFKVRMEQVAEYVGDPADIGY